MCAIGAAVCRSRPSGEAAMAPKVRWSTNRSSGPPSANLSRACRCGSLGSVRRAHQQLPAHPEMQQQRLLAAGRRSARRSHRYLPRRHTSRTSAPSTRAARSAGPGDVPPGDPDAADLGRLDAPAGQRARRVRAGRPRPRVARAPQGPVEPPGPPTSSASSGPADLSGRRGRGWPEHGLDRGPGLLGSALLGLLLGAPGAGPVTGPRRRRRPHGRSSRGRARTPRPGRWAHRAPPRSTAPAGWSSSPGPLRGRRSRRAAGRTGGARIAAAAGSPPDR